MNSHESDSAYSSVEDQDFLTSADLMWSLNEIRYRTQSEILLSRGEISYEIASKLFKFTLENQGCSVKTSTNGGSDFFLNNWIPLEGEELQKLTTLQFFIAISETRLQQAKGYSAV